MATARDNLARKQIYIPATQPEEEIVLRVAAYCRVSTDSDDQINSFASQNNHYTEMISAHDRWELIDIMRMKESPVHPQRNGRISNAFLPIAGRGASIRCW